MSSLNLTNAVWRKSSHSNGNGNECVEVAFVLGATALRDSKNPTSSALIMPPNGWAALRTTLTAG